MRSRIDFSNSEKQDVESLWRKCLLTPLTVEIVGHPVSINQMWKWGKHGTYKTDEAKCWEALAGMLTRSAARKAYGTSSLGCIKGRPLKLELKIRRPTWKGKTKAKRDLYVRPDLSNFIKSVEDGVMLSLGLDDCAVVEIEAKKVEAPGPDSTLVRICFLGE